MAATCISNTNSDGVKESAFSLLNYENEAHIVMHSCVYFFYSFICFFLRVKSLVTSPVVSPRARPLTTIVNPNAVYMIFSFVFSSCSGHIIISHILAIADSVCWFTSTKINTRETKENTNSNMFCI